MKELYTELTKDPKSSNFTDWINNKKPEVNTKEEQIVYNENPLNTLNKDKKKKNFELKPIAKAYTKDEYKNFICNMRDENNNLLTTDNNVIKKILTDNNILFAKKPLSVKTMINGINTANVMEKLYNKLIEAYPLNKKIGEGFKSTEEGNGLKTTEKAIHKKYFIDTHKLHNNVLEIRYNKNRHLTNVKTQVIGCLLYTSPSPRDGLLSRMPSSA